jgi:hypothetical protein
MPWLIALFKNNTFAGSIRTDVNGNTPVFTIQPTAAPAAFEIAVTIGLMMKNPKIARMPAQIPAEKLLINISKPGRILCSHNASSFFIDQPPNGPMIIAPMNIGMLVPVITPIVAIAPTTPPRVS